MAKRSEPREIDCLGEPGRRPLYALEDFARSLASMRRPAGEKLAGQQAIPHRIALTFDGENGGDRRDEAKRRMPDTLIQIPTYAFDGVAPDARPKTSILIEAADIAADQVLIAIGQTAETMLDAGPSGSPILEHLGLAAVWHCVQHYGERGPGSGKRTKLSLETLEAAMGRLRAVKMTSAELGALGSMFGLSPRRFLIEFRLATGLTPADWRRKHLLEAAKILLKVDGMLIAEVATRSGFRDQAYFSRVFLAETGMTPKEWRRAALR